MEYVSEEEEQRIKKDYRQAKVSNYIHEASKHVPRSGNYFQEHLGQFMRRWSPPSDICSIRGEIAILIVYKGARRLTQQGELNS
jgi:hypothetical protein